MAPAQSNSGVVIGGIIGGLILLVAVTACLFPFFRNWALERRSEQLANNKYLIRKQSLPDRINAPLLADSIPGHSRDNSYASSYYTGNYNNELAHADATPLMLHTDERLPYNDELQSNSYKAPSGATPRQPSRSETNYSTDSAYSTSLHSLQTIPAAKPPPSQPPPPVPLESTTNLGKRKGPPKDDSANKPLERNDTFAISKLIKARVQRGGNATPLRRPTDFSIIERSESITAAPPVPTINLPPVPKLPSPKLSQYAGPTRQIRPLPQTRNKSLRLPKAPMEPLVEMDFSPSALSEVFPEPAAKTWKALEVHLETPKSAGIYTPVLTQDSPEELSASEKSLTEAFRKSTLPSPLPSPLSSPVSDVAPRYPSIGAYPIIPPNSAPLTSAQSSAFPSTARYSMFPITAVPPDSAALTPGLTPAYGVAHSSVFLASAALPSSTGFPSPGPDDTPTQWAESIISAYGTSMTRYAWEQEYATTAPLRLPSTRRALSNRKTARRNALQPQGTQVGDGKARRKKPRLEVSTEFYGSSVYSDRTSLGSTWNQDRDSGRSSGSSIGTVREDSVALDPSEKARLREVGVKSTKQGLQERPMGVGQSYQARTFI